MGLPVDVEQGVAAHHHRPRRLRPGRHRFGLGLGQGRHQAGQIGGLEALLLHPRHDDLGREPGPDEQPEARR